MSPAQLAYWEGLVLIGGIFGIIFWKMFTGAISLKYLLHGDQLDSKSPSGYSTFVSPGRTQLLLFTIFVAGHYLIQVIHDPTVFPQVPTSLLVGLGGSHAVYLGGKAQSMLMGPLKDFLRRTQP
ncbi:MAG TPA: hypothetical protein VI636_01700 [Candidatus Angelobacter sp.]